MKHFFIPSLSSIDVQRRRKIVYSAPIRLAFAAILVVCAAFPARAATQTFDTPTATTLATETTYGMAAQSPLALALVSGGELRLSSPGINGNFTFGAFAGDVTFGFDAGISGAPGLVNVGYSAGNSTFYFHPGLWDNYFVTGVAGASGNMGFIPDLNQKTHIMVAVNSASKSFAVTLENGANAYNFSYVDPAYVPGTSLLGFTVGHVNAPVYGVFDNLTVTAVPEPEGSFMLLLGLALVAHLARRSSGQPSARWSARA
jgi:hypothetical protein